MEDTTMRMERLSISRAPSYVSDAGKLRGTVSFLSKHGEVTLNLDEQTSRDIIRLCSEGIVRSTKFLADEITADVVEGNLALEDKTQNSEI